ncbi:MAG TPA: M28 family peptidase, partial [Anaerolineales bacterium]|nr:M28 family peptidase [Anaerolineales bacterium]
MRFDANRALDYARRISFPRKVGTEGESEAAAAITDWFTGMGYEVERQPFRFSYALERLIKLEIFLGQALILAGLAVRWRFPELEIVLAGLVLLLLAFAPFSQRAIINGSLADRGSGPGSWRSRAAELLGSHHEAANIIASRTPHRQEGLRPHLVLMAHYDSKSQTIPLPARMFFFVMLVVGAAGYSLFVFSSQVIPAAREVSLLAAVLALLSGIPLLLLGTGNKSNGSLDNAAGVGLLVHLAEVLASREDVRSGLKVTFVATGAEEYALMGARAFLQSRSSDFADERRMAGVYLLNFDGTGGEGKLNISGR